MVPAQTQQQTIGRVGTLMAGGLVYLFVNVVLRLVLWGTFGAAGGVHLAQLPGILLAGALSDLFAVVFVMLPLTALVVLVPRRFAAARWLWSGVLLGVASLVVFGAAAEWFFFEEFDARFNLVAVDYLRYPHEVLVNIEESYPVTAAVGVAVALGALLAWGATRLVHPPEWGRRKLLVGHLGLALLLGLLGARSPAYNTTNRVRSELAKNGAASFAAALVTNDLEWSSYYVVDPLGEAATRWADELGRSGVRAEVLADGRVRSVVAPRPGGAGPRNIVVVVEESLGANHVSALRAEELLTPNLDAIASEGLLFTEAFATGTRTVRGLEALTLSFPPLPGESVVRRPGSVGMANWGEQLRQQGYNTSFLYGGYAYFDDMAEFFGGNGFTVSDRTEIDDPRFANIWGVSDEDLFAHAVRWFDARASEGKPFFSIVLTTSNHKPFTFRPGVPGVPEEGGGRLAGVRYADFALGTFFDEARRHAWFDDTLFVVLGDHGARVYGATQIPVESYRIPVVFYAPAFLPPARSAIRLSQIDVMPTVLGLLGLGWEGPFFGRDAFADQRNPRPIPLNHNYAVGVLEGDSLALLDFGKVAEVVTWNELSGGYEAREADPEQLATAVALFETADRLYRDDLWH